MMLHATKKIVGFEWQWTWWPLSRIGSRMPTETRPPKPPFRRRAAQRWRVYTRIKYLYGIHKFLEWVAVDKHIIYYCTPTCCTPVRCGANSEVKKCMYSLNEHDCRYRLDRPNLPLPLVVRFLYLSSSRVLALCCLG